FLLECGDAFQGIAMATLPISDLLAEFEVLTLQALDFGAQLEHFPVRALDWVNQLRGGAAWTTDLYQLVDHDRLGLPRRPRFGKRRVSFYPLQTDLYGRDRRSFTDVPHQVCEFHVIKEITKAVLHALVAPRKKLRDRIPKQPRGRPRKAERAQSRKATRQQQQ